MKKSPTFAVIPRVVISEFELIPWNPAIITIFPKDNSLVILLVSICSIIAFWFVLFVNIPACHPVKDIDLYPNWFNKILNWSILIKKPNR